MYGSLIDGHIKRTTQNLLTINLTILGIMTTVFGILFVAMRSNSKPVGQPAEDSASKPPKAITASDLRGHETLNSFSNRHVSLKAPNAVDLEWNITDLSGRLPKYDFTREKYTYHLVDVGGKSLLVLPGLSGSPFVGTLTELEQKDRQAVETVVQSRGQPKPDLLPYALYCLPDASNGPGHGTSFLLGMLWIPLLFMAVPAGYAVIALMRRGNPLTHPIGRLLSRFGPPQAIGQAIEAEMRAGCRTIGPALFTQNWALVTRSLSVTLIPLENLIWVYERSRGPFGPWSELVAVPRVANEHVLGEYVFYARRSEVAAIIDQITGPRPWLITGWTPQIRSDMLARRQEVIAYVDERRRHFLSGQGVPIQHGACPPHRP